MPNSSMKRNVRPSTNMCLTLDRALFDDAYMIKYGCGDKQENTIRLMCDAMLMDFKGVSKPGPPRYAVILPRFNNLNFVKKGTNSPVIQRGEEIFREF